MPRLRERAVKALERAACRPVHQREGDDGGGENSAVPCHYKFNAELHQKNADWALCAEDEQQKIAAYRRRQYHGKRENNVKNTLDRTRQPCRVVGKEYAREKNYYAAYSRNAQGVYIETYPTGQRSEGIGK